VLVNDDRKRRLVVYDQSLSIGSVMADATGKPALYPNRTMMKGFFDYMGDSALIVDVASLVFLVVDPTGRVSRAMAPPNPRELNNLSSPFSGSPAFDHRGRFIYRGPVPSRPGPVPGAVTEASPRSRDTVPILRADFDSRIVDTIAHVSIPVLNVAEIVRDDKGKASATQVINPLPMPGDEWVVTSDGSLAIVNAYDYHIDWVLPDGRRVSTARMPFDWRPVRDEDKKARVDSVVRLIDSLRTTPLPFGWMLTGRPGGGVDTVIASVEFVPFSEMPDYYPPFRSNTAKADRDNNVWIPPTTTYAQTAGGVIYDLINKKGEIFERVVIPAGRRIVGFGPHGVVYLLSGNRDEGFALERRHILRAGPI